MMWVFKRRAGGMRAGHFEEHGREHRRRCRWMPGKDTDTLYLCAGGAEEEPTTAPVVGSLWRRARRAAPPPIPPIPTTMARLLLILSVVLFGPVSRAGDAAPAVLQPLSSVLDPITKDPLFTDSSIGLQVVRVSTGDEVYAFQPDADLLPASVMKVLTSATALHRLGPAWRFETAFYRDGEISSEGVLEGDLYVRGTGDPTMVVEKLWKMLGDLAVEGVLEIDGDIYFDDSYFDERWQIVGWDKKIDVATGPSYFPPLGALSINYNTVSIVVAPGMESGALARVEQETPCGYVEIVNEVETGARGSRPWTRIEREVDEKEGVVRFTVQGRVALGDDVTRHYRTVDDPTDYFISVFRQVLKERGITVTGKLRRGRLPADAVPVVRMLSPPLSEILNHTNKFSSNFMAEQVLKAVGAEVHGVPGSTAKGIDVIEEYLTELGIPESDYVLVNGSGLTRKMHLRPSQVNAVLLDMYSDWKLAPEFMASLSVAGVDGTLRRRYRDDDEAARIRGKTGSLDGVYCLAGYVLAGDGEVYAFTLFVNGFRRVRPVRALHDRFGEALLAMSDVDSSGISAVPGGGTDASGTDGPAVEDGR